MWWKIILAMALTCYLGFFMNFAIFMWQALPIKEEKSTPLYITKVLFNEKD